MNILQTESTEWRGRWVMAGLHTQNPLARTDTFELAR
jgi:hypothetical protein